MTGRALAEAGMQQTLAFESDDWLADALDALQRFGRLPAWSEFKTEDFRAWYRSTPHDHHVWGALTNRACKAGILEWTGRYAPSVSPKTHGHPVKVWRLSSPSQVSKAWSAASSFSEGSHPLVRQTTPNVMQDKAYAE